MVQSKLELIVWSIAFSSFYVPLPPIGAGGIKYPGCWGMRLSLCVSLCVCLVRHGYVKSVINLEQLLQDYDNNLFSKAKSTCYNLRTFGHGLSAMQQDY